MIDIFNTITLDNKTFYRPNDFTPEKENVYQGEYTSCTGKTLADCIGWKYADITLEWDTLPDDMMTDLIGLTGVFTFGFTDSSGVQSENVIITGFANTATRFTENGVVMWKNVQLGLKFIDVHN